MKLEDWSKGKSDCHLLAQPESTTVIPTMSTLESTSTEAGELITLDTPKLAKKMSILVVATDVRPPQLSREKMETTLITGCGNFG